jgi:Tripartite tricarboxylate transporter family receptor
MLADALVEHGLPRHQLETDAVIDHGEAAARELGGANKCAADVFAGLGGGERQTAFGSHGLADTSNLRTLQIGDKILGHTDTVVLQPDGVAHVHEVLPAALHCLSDLPAEPDIGKHGTAGRSQFPVEPGRAVMTDLAVETGRRQDGDADVGAVPRAIVGLTTLGKIRGNAPVIGIDPLGMAGPSQRLQPADILGNWLSERLGQPVVIENKPGAGTMLSIQAAVNSPPDGYTLVLFGSSTAIGSRLYAKLPFDPLRDIAPVAGLITWPMVLEANPSVPAKTVGELIAYTKAFPGRISMASFGTGTPSHIAGELLKMMTGINMIHVPYRGGDRTVRDRHPACNMLTPRPRELIDTLFRHLRRQRRIGHRLDDLIDIPAAMMGIGDRYIQRIANDVDRSQRDIKVDRRISVAFRHTKVGLDEERAASCLRQQPLDLGPGTRHLLGRAIQRILAEQLPIQPVVDFPDGSPAQAIDVLWRGGLATDLIHQIVNEHSRPGISRFWIGRDPYCSLQCAGRLRHGWTFRCTARCGVPGQPTDRRKILTEIATGYKSSHRLRRNRHASLASARCRR